MAVKGIGNNPIAKTTPQNIQHKSPNPHQNKTKNPYQKDSYESGSSSVQERWAKLQGKGQPYAPWQPYRTSKVTNSSSNDSNSSVNNSANNAQNEKKSGPEVKEKLEALGASVEIK